MEKLTWVVVANGSKARVFLSEKGGALQSVEEWENPTAHLKTSDLVSDKPGRSFESNGAGRHAMEPPIGPHQEQVLKFVRTVAHGIEKAHGEGAFQRLYLVASPEILGHLRKLLPAQVTQALGDEVSKDLTASSVDQIREHLPFVL